MKSLNRDDLKINGSMSVAGGKFKNVIINGRGELQTDLETEKLKVNGSASFCGKVKANDVKINGNSIIEGDAELQSINISGSLELSSKLKSGAIKILGELAAKGDVDAKSIDNQGKLTVGGNCRAENINVIGEIKVEKELSADVVSIDLYGKSFAGDIGGETIKIRRYPESKISKFLMTIFLIELFRHASMKTETIEGDEIYLEFTKAKVVRGKNVVIGPGCEIDYVEYETLKKDKKAVIKEEKKV